MANLKNNFRFTIHFVQANFDAYRLKFHVGYSQCILVAAISQANIRSRRTKNVIITSRLISNLPRWKRHREWNFPLFFQKKKTRSFFFFFLFIYLFILLYSFLEFYEFVIKPVRFEYQKSWQPFRYGQCVLTVLYSDEMSKAVFSSVECIKKILFCRKKNPIINSYTCTIELTRTWENYYKKGLKKKKRIMQPSHLSFLLSSHTTTGYNSIAKIRK